MIYCDNKGVEIKSLDLGGGFPIEKNGKSYSPNDFGYQLVDLLKRELKNAGMLPTEDFSIL